MHQDNYTKSIPHHMQKAMSINQFGPENVKINTLNYQKAFVVDSAKRIVIRRHGENNLPPTIEKIYGVRHAVVENFIDDEKVVDSVAVWCDDIG